MTVDRANVDEVTKQQRAWPWRGSSSFALQRCDGIELRQRDGDVVVKSHVRS